MKNLDLNDFGVQEMNVEEMVMIEGGNWFEDIGEAICDTWNWIKSRWTRTGFRI